MEIKYKKVSTGLYKVLINGANKEFCLVAKTDNTLWRAWNSSASRSAEKREYAVQLLIESLS